MDHKYKKLLTACDENKAYEFPSKFNYPEREKEALTVNRRLEKELELHTSFEDGYSNQDASFSFSISLHDFQYRDERGIFYIPVIRFSNFGRLVTLTMVDLIGEEISNAIISVLDEESFDYIPETVLDEPYDGVMSGHKDLPTWWIRYFDWI